MRRVGSVNTPFGEFEKGVSESESLSLGALRARNFLSERREE